MTRVLFLVCHLAGSGHLARTLAIARAVAQGGGRPLVVTGGRPLPHLDAATVETFQLPPVSIRDGDYAALLTPDGVPVDAAYRAARAAALAAAVRGFAPDVVVTELWPFGRRALAEEFRLALALAPQARAVCSARDIPEPPRKPGRAPEAHAALRARFAAVLAHGDPAVAPFALGWPQAAEIADLLRPTGYVAEPLPPPTGDAGEVLVAEGGGALGRRLLATAVEAARGGARPWRLRVGGADAAQAAARLAAGARGAPVIVEPAAADYRARLRTCAASVSLCGYNTAVDLLQTGAPAVLVPNVDGGEREQTLRARALAARPQFETLDPDDLTPAALAAAVARALRKPRAPATDVDMTGAETSARLILSQE
jgi:predicted glycosyltransferase